MIGAGEQEVYRFRDFELDAGAAELRRKGECVRIFPRAFDLLLYLVRHRERMVPRQELLNALWPDVTVTAAVLTQTVWELRKALGDASEHAELIRNSRGRGYRFVGEASLCATPRGANGVSLEARTRVSARSASALPFVGREAELQRLKSALDAALEGRGSVALIGGEAGIGKTRAAEEIANVARASGAAVFEGVCFEAQSGPAFWPWLQIVRGMAGELSTRELREYMQTSIADLCRFSPDFKLRFPDAPEPPARAAEEDRFYLLDGVVNLLMRASQARPLCLVLDDLQWADRPSLLLLEMLASMAARGRIFVVGTYRTGELSENGAFGQALATLARHCDRISLSGLSADEVVRLLAGEAHGLDRALALEVHRITAGNPLFALQIARLVASDGASRLTLGDAQLALPDEVREVIARRIARLPKECIEGLRWAAALGARFRLSDLRHVMDQPQASVLELLQIAVDARIVVEQQLGMYRFVHPLMREALHQSLRLPERARLHQRIGLVLEALCGPDDVSRLDELAYHFCEAAAIGSAERAVAYAERAGERAFAATAYEAAAEYFAKALSALELSLPIDVRHGAELRLRRGEALRGARENPETVRAAFREVFDFGKARGDAQLMARAALGYAGLGPLRMWLTREAGTVDPVEVALLEQALAALPETDSKLRALALGQLAHALYNTRESKRREQLATSAVEMARRVGDGNTLAEVLLLKHWVITAPDQLDERLALTQEIIALTEVMELKGLELDAHVQRAYLLLQRGQLASAEADIAFALRLAEEMQQPDEKEWANGFEMLRLFWQGRYAEGERESKRFLELHVRRKRAGMDQGHAIRMFASGCHQGRGAEVVAAQAAIAEKYPLPVVWRCGLSSIYGAIGRFEEARRELERLAVNDFEDLPFDHNWLTCHLYLAMTCHYLGDRERAALVYRALEPYAERMILIGHASMFGGSVYHPLALVAHTLERWDKAEEFYMRAFERTQTFGATAYIPFIELDYAEMLCQRGKGRDLARARQLGESALSGAKCLGLGDVLRRSMALLDRLGVQPVADPS